MSKAKHELIVSKEKIDGILNNHLSQIRDLYNLLNSEQKGDFLENLENLVLEIGERKIILASSKRKNIVFNPKIAKRIRENAGLKPFELAKQLSMEDYGYQKIYEYEAGRRLPSNPPRGKSPRLYMEWLKSKGYNPYNL